MTTAKVKHIAKYVNMGISIASLVVAIVVVGCELVDFIAKEKQQNYISNT